MKNKPSSLKELQAALTDTGISLETLKARICRAALDVPLFNTAKDGTCPGYVYCPNVCIPKDGGTWCAYIAAANGKTYEQDFTIDGEAVKFSGDPEEVMAETEYTPVQAGDVAGHEFHGNQHTSGESAKADNSSKKASAESLKAASSGTKEDHDAAARSNHDAASAHLLARDKYAKGSKEYDEHQHAIKFHEDRAAVHEKESTKMAKAAKPAEASSQEKPMHALEAEVMVMADDTPAVFSGFMAMAGGVQTFTLGCDGKPVEVTIDVNAAGARALQAQLEIIGRSTQQQAFNCFFHEKKTASSWPKKFFWLEAAELQKRFPNNPEIKKLPGAIMEAAEPSEAGKKAIMGKECRGFSLTFFTNADPVPLPLDAGWMIPAGAPGSPENPAKIICPPNVAENPTKYLNMGTLTNRPASTKNQPLFASQDAGKNLPAPVAPARAGAQSSKNTNTKNKMDKPLDAEALQARNTQLEQKITELEAQETAVAKAQLEAARAELSENKTKIELANSQKQIAAFEAEKKEQVKATATAAVRDMIESQQIPALDKEMQASWQEKFEKDPTLIPLIVKKGGAGARRVTPNAGSIELNAGVHADPFSFSVPIEMKQMLALTNRNAAIRITPSMSKAQMEAAYEEKGKLALQAGLLFKKTLNPHFDDWKDIPSQDLAKCVGLDAQAMQFNRRAFEAADYADPNNQFQTLNGTLVLQRTLPLFAYDYPELLTMFTDFSDTPGLYQQTEQSRVVNIPAVLLYNAGLDANGRPIGFVVASPASTVDAPLTLSAYIAVPIVIGQATLSSTQRRLFDEIAPAGIKAIASYFVGMVTVLLTPQNYNAYVNVTPADANGVQKVPVAYATYSKGLQDFSATDFDKWDAIFSQNQVPGDNRGVLLNTLYFAKMRSDPRIAYYYATRGADAQLTEAGLPPKISSFAPFKAPYLPANVPFFPYHKAGIMLKSRLPMDFSQAVNAMIPGSITTVTDPDTKISVALVQRVDLVGNYAEWRPEVQLGANVGDKRGGLCGAAQ